jgi:phosphatidate cytidylyltransferase
MAAAAIAVAWAGGALFALFWGVAAVIVFAEWAAMAWQKPGFVLWTVLGFCYALVLFVAATVLRSDVPFGFLAIVFLYAVVWITDTTAYVVGRLVGGPKLCPAISPKKTWSGAVGGTLGAIIGGSIVAFMSGLAATPLALLAAILSIAAQAGDLVESAVKRRFGVKDSSHIIPGHGGLMDRLDSFVAACLLAAVIGTVREDWAHAGHGLLAW